MLPELLSGSITKKQAGNYAYLLTKVTRYIDAALIHIRVWFTNEETEMNPSQCSVLII
jgi:hypothetical protein